MELSKKELIELQYAYLKGYKYLTKSDYWETVRVHRTEPKYYEKEPKNLSQWADHLSDMGNWCPLSNFDLKIGEYKSLEVGQCLLIEDLINTKDFE